MKKKLLIFSILRQPFIINNKYYKITKTKRYYPRATTLMEPLCFTEIRRLFSLDTLISFSLSPKSCAPLSTQRKKPSFPSLFFPFC